MKIEYSSTSILNKLCEKYGCDKGIFLKIIITILIGHLIIILIFMNFCLLPKEIKLKGFLNLGLELIKFLIKTWSEKKPGASLRVWNEYFKNATIYGADIDKSTLFEEKKIKTFYVDQTCKSQLKICGKISRFQILT